MEASEGIEPPYKDLQSSASPLRHEANRLSGNGPHIGSADHRAQDIFGRAYLGITNCTRIRPAQREGALFGFLADPALQRARTLLYRISIPR